MCVVVNLISYVLAIMLKLLLQQNCVLTHNHQAVLASCNADTDLVPVSNKAQVCPQPPNISFFLPSISGSNLVQLS